MSINDNTRNALMFAGGLSTVKGNQPKQYVGRKHQYFEDATSRFQEAFLKYASDFFAAVAQGLNPDDPTEWRAVNIRLADYIPLSYIVKPTSVTTRPFDDNKIIKVEDRSVQYIPLGAKFVTMGSTWLSIAPQNISNGDGITVVQRCNATWNHYDYYGNILEEPIVVQSIAMAANENEYGTAVVNPKGYFTVLCQYNEYTRQLDTNSRLILGRGAYHITGYSDYAQEFTGDYGSVDLIEFYARLEEPNLEIDDMANHVAGGKQFSWVVGATGGTEFSEGNTIQFGAYSLRDGVEVTPTAEYPVSYTWRCANENVEIENATGDFTGLEVGVYDITVSLDQNPNISYTFGIVVAAATGEGELKFTSAVPTELEAYNSVRLTADWLIDGVSQNVPIAWSFEGADPEAYTTHINQDGSVTISCWAGSVSPLEVRAGYEDADVVAKIVLTGI